MGATLYLFVVSTYAFFLVVQAGKWDSFDMGYAYAGDASKCFSMKHNIQMLINNEYQVPNECTTILCNESYIISERKLEVGKKYDSIGACGRISCDAKGNLEIEVCSPRVPEPLCSVSKVDLKYPYPACCPTLICA